MLVLICRAVYIFVEQPASSRLFVVPYFTFIQEVCQRFSIPSHNYFLPESQVSEKKGFRKLTNEQIPDDQLGKYNLLPVPVFKL